MQWRGWVRSALTTASAIFGAVIVAPEPQVPREFGWPTIVAVLAISLFFFIFMYGGMTLLSAGNGSSSKLSPQHWVAPSWNGRFGPGPLTFFYTGGSAYFAVGLGAAVRHVLSHGLDHINTGASIMAMGVGILASARIMARRLKRKRVAS